MSSLFAYSDPFGSAATQYDVWNDGSGGGHFVLNGVTLAANQDNIITAAQLAQLSYQSGSGTDTLRIRANDGTVWGDWSNPFKVTAPVDTGPVIGVSNRTATHGQSFAVSSLFTYSDSFGSAATQYDVWNDGSGGGHFVLDGVTLAANQDHIITAAQLAQLSYQSGSGTDMLKDSRQRRHRLGRLVESLQGDRTGRYRSCHRGLEPHGGAWSKLCRVEPVRL